MDAEQLDHLHELLGRDQPEAPTKRMATSEADDLLAQFTTVVQGEFDE